MKNILLALFLGAFFTINVQAQQEISWVQLADVSFTEEYSDELASYIMIPAFGEKVRALEGKRVKIQGYVIPLDVELNQYVLSANPFASCFFCGGAGPETVMDVILKEKSKFRTDEYVSIVGRLVLNKDDVYKLNYILEDAEVLKK